MNTRWMIATILLAGAWRAECQPAVTTVYGSQSKLRGPAAKRRGRRWPRAEEARAAGPTQRDAYRSFCIYSAGQYMTWMSGLTCVKSAHQGSNVSVLPLMV